MATYLELLQSMESRTPRTKDCSLGKILSSEGREKHDEILEAIFAVKSTGELYPVSWLIEAFEEYGWSEFFFRRHRDGKCVSCLNRTKTN